MEVQPGGEGRAQRWWRSRPMSLVLMLGVASSWLLRGVRGVVSLFQWHR